MNQHNIKLETYEGSMYSMMVARVEVMEDHSKI